VHTVQPRCFTVASAIVGIQAVQQQAPTRIGQRLEDLSCSSLIENMQVYTCMSIASSQLLQLFPHFRIYVLIGEERLVQLEE
jgi:hypothetical protein